MERERSNITRDATWAGVWELTAGRNWLCRLNLRNRDTLVVRAGFREDIDIKYVISCDPKLNVD